jgi:hypothetical protein
VTTTRGRLAALLSRDRLPYPNAIQLASLAVAAGAYVNFGVLPSGFAILLGFMIWCVGEPLKGATSAIGDRASMWFVQPPRRFRQDRCQTRRCDFAPGRLSGDGPCDRLAGRPGRHAGLLAGPSGG